MRAIAHCHHARPPAYSRRDTAPDTTMTRLVYYFAGVAQAISRGCLRREKMMLLDDEERRACRASILPRA